MTGQGCCLDTALPISGENGISPGDEKKAQEQFIYAF
jgi:hypothetical protein